MIDDIKEVLGSLNSPADWAIVGAAGLAGFVLDAAINIVPLPIFSPGVCGATAAGMALTAKRGFEARQQSQRRARLIALYADEARRIATDLMAGGHMREALALQFDIDAAVAEVDLGALKDAVARGRSRS